MKEKTKEKRFYSPKKQKILLLLYAGVALGLARSPKQSHWIFKQLAKEWKDVKRQYLYRIVREFKYERLIDWKDKNDGTTEIVLTEKGKRWALKFDIDKIELKKPQHWDKKWRVVFYDIPEKKKPAREALRKKLKEMGFYELQKSVFVHPFPCKNEIEFIVEILGIRNFVRCGEMENLTNEATLKLYFGL